MKLEQQVCSLDLAKRLKELGVKQESLYWFSKNAPGPVLFDRREREDQIFVRRWSKDDFISAFTVAELGEMLPEYVSYSKLTCEGDSKPTWFVEGDQIIGETRDDHKNRCFTEDSEADARAKMLIYLLENKLMEV